MREQHGRDESSFDVPRQARWCLPRAQPTWPDAVRLAAQYRVPVIPAGVGTSLEGHLLAVQGGISLDVSRMDQVCPSTPRT